MVQEVQLVSGDLYHFLGSRQSVTDDKLEGVLCEGAILILRSFPYELPRL